MSSQEKKYGSDKNINQGNKFYINKRSDVMKKKQLHRAIICFLQPQFLNKK